MGIVLIARCYTQGSGNGFSSRNLWLWLINHRVPRNEIDRQPIKVYLDLFKQSYSKSGEQRPHWNQHAREFCVHRLSITQWKQRLVLRRKDTAVTLHRPTHSTFCLVFPNGAGSHLTCILVYCGKGKYLNLGDIRYWLKFLGTCNSTVVSWIESGIIVESRWQMVFWSEFISWLVEWDSPNYPGLIFSDPEWVLGMDILGDWQTPQFLSSPYKDMAVILWQAIRYSLS